MMRTPCTATIIHSRTIMSMSVARTLNFESYALFIYGPVTDPVTDRRDRGTGPLYLFFLSQFSTRSRNLHITFLWITESQHRNSQQSTSSFHQSKHHDNSIPTFFGGGAAVDRCLFERFHGHQQPAISKVDKGRAKCTLS